MRDTQHENGPFISTMPAEAAHRRLAAVATLVSTATFAAVAPFAQVALRPVWAFIPIYESVLTVNDLITAVLLFGQFAILRSPALLVLAAGYLFTGSMASAHALSFPGLFSPSGLFGSGPQSTVWLYMFWHATFPLFVIAYAVLVERRPVSGRISAALAATVAAVAAVVCAITALVTAGHDWLPALMDGNRYTEMAVFVTCAVWGSSLAALLAMWRWRRRSVLDLWLVVVMVAWLFDVALSTVLNGGRFDVGFYAGRIYGALAGSFVLVVLLLENSMLYARLVRANEGERRKGQELAAANAELKALNKELDSFSYSVSHDLRAPLRAISGFARILEEDYGPRLDDEARRYIGVIGSACQRMGQLIEDLLQVCRLGRQPLRTRRIDLDSLVAEIVDELRVEGTAARTRFKVGPLGAVDADPTLLKQAVVNLVGNAVKFSSRRDDPVVEIGCSAGGHGADRTFFVKDNGAGFDMEHAGQLFGMFCRLHGSDYEGTGVGLAMVRRIMERHGGRIWAEARPGEGASFYFTLEGGAATRLGEPPQQVPS